MKSVRSNTLARLKRSLQLALGLSLVSGAAMAQDKPVWCASNPVKFAAVTWESAQFYTELARFITENGFDCKTELVTGSTAVTETALVSNDLQVWMEQWNRTDVIKKGKVDGKIDLVGDLLKGGTLEGWFVPEYVIKGDAKRNIKASAPDLKTVADLPKYKALFKDDEDPSKGRFFNCPSGWDCERINNQKFKAYKLGDDYVNFRPGTGGTLDAAISSAYERGRPVLFYYWAPAGLMGKYKFTQLTEPAFNETCWKTLMNSTTDAACPSAFPSTKLSAGVSVPFQKGAPEIVAMLSKLQLPAEQLNAIIADMSERKVGGAVVAKEYLQKNKAAWKTWVSAPVAARIETKL